MPLSSEITAQIKDILKENPQGLSITDLVKSVGINRNTPGRYLDNLLVSGEVEMRPFGMSKIYTLSQRIPASSVLSISSEFVLQLDGNLRIIFANDPFLRFLGVSSQHLLGKNIEYTRVALDFEDVFPDFLTRLKTGLSGTAWQGELALPGRGMTFNSRIAPTVFGNGLRGVSCLLDDITDKKRTEERVFESEDRYRKLVERSPDTILLHRDGKIIYANPAAFNLLGASRADEIVGKPLFDFIRSGYRDGVMANIQKDLGGGVSPPMEVEMIRLDGTSVMIEGWGVQTFTDCKPAVQVAIRDITERKRTEVALRESEARYRSLSEASQDLIFVVDREDKVLYINHKAAALLRKPAEMVINQPRSTFFPPDISTRQYEALQHVFRTGQPVRSEGPVMIRDEILWFDHALVPIADTGGRVASVLGVSRDITKRINAEREIREKEENYRFIAEHSVDIINRQTPECICTYTSPSVTTLLGYAEEEVLGRCVLELVHPDDLPGVMKDIGTIRRLGLTDVTSVFRFRHRDGHYLWFESTTRIVRDEAGQITEFLSISRDITGRKPDSPCQTRPAGIERRKKRGIRTG